MLQRICLVFSGCLFSLVVAGKNQQFVPLKPEPQPVQVVQPPKPAQPVFNYKKLNTELEYAFVINKPGSQNPQEGDQINVNMQMISNNRLLFNSFQSFKGKPAVYGVTKPAFKGDIIEAIMLMTPGDSIVCLVDADALFKNTKNKRPDFIKAGDKVQYFMKLISIKTKAQLQKEQQDAFTKQINEQMAKQKVAAAKQVITDDKILKDWFAKKKISPTKTPSGLYYTIKEEGTGEIPAIGDSVTLNYTGTLPDGTKFDSNEDTAFHHVQPYQFVLGTGPVISGWHVGVALLKVGTKATLYIPSGMAYGTQSRPGSAANPKGIPPNSILVFDVHLLSNKHGIPLIPATLKKDSSGTAVPLQIQKNDK